MLWARDWALLYGSTAVGAAVVLAAYFGGLALGGALGAVLPARRRPLVVYALLEAGVAAAVVGYLALRPRLPAAAVSLAAVVAPSLLPVARALLAFVVLLVPTTLLGATLPVLVHDRTRVGGLYAANTIGGAAGAVLVATVAVRTLGVRGSFVAGIAVDGAVAVAALVLAAVVGAMPASEPPATRRPAGALGIAALLGLIGVGGEVLWLRGLASVASNSVYTVAFVLAGVILGLAVGARIAARAGDGDVRRALARACVLLAVAIAGSLVCIQFLPSLLARGARVLAVTGPGTGLALEAALALLVVLPPAVALGAAFPLCVGAAAGSAQRATGRVLAVDTAGGIAGALVVAFVVLPGIGVAASLLLLAALALAAAAVAGAPRWPALVVVALAGAAAVVVPRIGGDHVIFRRDGAAATVTVTAEADGKRLRVNGQYSLGGAGGLFLERREAHLPLLLHPAPRRLLALGVGTGDTIGAALAHPGLTIDGVELVPEVLDAAKLFAAENGGVLDDPRAHLHVDDARSFLLASTDAWDVIVADLFLPWTAGTAALYSAETYRLGRAHLRPGGLYCQWLPLHQLDVADLESIVATFAGVFPEVQLWIAYHRAATPLAALVGSETPIRPDADALRARLADPTLAGALAAVGLDDPADLAALYVADKRRLGVAVEDVDPITDDRPALEFTAPGAYFHQARLARAALAWTMARLDGRGPIAGAPSPFSLRATLLVADLSLLDGDRPRELAAYLEALKVAPGLRTTRTALAAIARERLAAGDRDTADRIARELDGTAPPS